MRARNVCRVSQECTMEEFQDNLSGQTYDHAISCMEKYGLMFMMLSSLLLFLSIFLHF